MLIRKPFSIEAMGFCFRSGGRSFPETTTNLLVESLKSTHESIDRRDESIVDLDSAYHQKTITIDSLSSVASNNHDCSWQYIWRELV